METGWVIATAVVFFGIGLGVGLYFLRYARATAVLEARRDADTELATLRQQISSGDVQAEEACRQLSAAAQRASGDQQRIVQLTGELARAQAAGEEVQTLRQRTDQLQRDLGKSVEDRVRLSTDLDADRKQGGEAKSSLERQLAERKGELESAQATIEAERARSSAASEQLVKARADLEATQARAASIAEDLATMRRRVEQLQGDNTKLIEERTRLASEVESEKKAGAERVQDAERNKEQVRAEIEKLAGRLLDEKGQAMLAQSRESLDALLTPVREKLKEFETKVDNAYMQDNRDRAALLDSLKKLQDTQTKLHQDAESLARALTGDSKAQGDWGELVLERILESAGLTEGREYDLQVSHVDDDGGHKRPDALVYLPENRALVVDAKCSLTAFVEATRALTDEAREAAMDAHVASVRSHVKSLAGKSYQNVLRQRTLDIVLMFVPSEAAFQAAIARDATLGEAALRLGVVIVSPTTLLATLQVVNHVWRSERQNVNAQRIAGEAGRLLDKLGAFLVDLDAVGARLGQAQQSFESARNKLAVGKGNVMKKARDLLALGAQVKPDRAQVFLLDAGDEDGDVAFQPPALEPADPDIAPVLAKS